MSETNGTEIETSTTALATPSPVAEVLPAPVSDEVLDATVAALKAAVRDGTLRTGIEMGRIIIENLYGGDLDAWRARGERDTSFRKLRDRIGADSDERAPGASTLARACGLYEVEQHLSVTALEHITASHVHVILGLPVEMQRKLLTRADDEGWTTRELADWARRERKREGGSPGRPPLPRFVKTLNRFGKLLEGDSEAFGDLDELDELDEEEVTRLYQTATGMKIQLENLQKALQPKVKGFGGK